MRPSTFPRLAPRFAAPLLAAALIAQAAAPAARAADTAEADRLRALFESHLGTPAAGEPRVVTVTPVGDGYELAIDFDRLAAPLQVLGLDLKAGRHVATLTPDRNGDWSWKSNTFDPLTWKVQGQTGRLGVEGWHAEGVFSTALAAFTEQHIGADRIVSEQTVAAHDDTPRFDVRRTDEAVAVTVTGKAAAKGDGIDATVEQTTKSTIEVLSLTEGKAAGIPDMEATLKMGPTRVGVVFEGLRTRPLFALWRHLVAHHGQADFTTGQADLKARLRDLGPLFERMRETVSADTIEVETPVGFGTIGHLEGAVDLTGATNTGDAELRLVLNGLEVHSLFIPAWANRLVPRELTVRAKGSGWDAASALAVFLARADFAAGTPLDDAATAELRTKLLPHDGVEIDLAGNRAKASDWDLGLDGKLTAAPAGLSGTVTVRAQGLEAAISALRDPAAGDAGKTAADQLSVALTFADRRDGALFWTFAIEGDQVRVNDRLITPPTIPSSGSQKSDDTEDEAPPIKGSSKKKK